MITVPHAGKDKSPEPPAETEAKSEVSAETVAVKEKTPEPVAAKDKSSEPPTQETVSHARKDKSLEPLAEADAKLEVSAEPAAVKEESPEPVVAKDKSPEPPTQETVPHAGKDKSPEPLAETGAKSEVSAETVAVKEKTPEPVAAEDKSPEPPTQETVPHAGRDKSPEPLAETGAKSEVSAESVAVKEKTHEPVAAEDKSPEPPTQETVPHAGKDKSPEPLAETGAKSEVSAETVAVKEKTPEPVAAEDKSPEPLTQETVPHAGRDKSPEPPAETDAKLKASAEAVAVKEKSPEPVPAHDKSPEPPAEETVPHAGKDKSLESPAETEAKSEVSAETVAVKEKTPEPVAAEDKSPEPPTQETVPHAGRDESPEPPAETDAKLKASAEPAAVKEKSPEPVPAHDKSPEPPAQETVPHAGKDKSPQPPAETGVKLNASAEPVAVKGKSPEPVPAHGKSPEPPAEETVPHAGKGKSLESPAETEAKSEVSAEPVAVKKKTPEPVAAKDKSPEPPTQETVPHAGRDKSLEPPAETEAKSEVSAGTVAVKEKTPEPVAAKDKSPEPPAQETVPHAGKDKSLESPAETEAKSEVSAETVAVKDRSPEPVPVHDKSPEPPAQETVPHAGMDKSLEPPGETDAKLEVSAEPAAVREESHEPFVAKDKSPVPPAKVTVPHAGKDKSPEAPAEPEAKLEVSTEPHAVKEESPELVAAGDRSPVTSAKESAPHAGKDKSPEPPGETDAKLEASAEPAVVKEESHEPFVAKDKSPVPPAKVTVPHAGKDKSPEPPAETDAILKASAQPDAVKEKSPEPVPAQDKSPEPHAQETMPHAGKDKSLEPSAKAEAKSEVSLEPVAVKDRSPVPVPAHDKSPEPPSQETVPYAGKDKSLELPAEADAKLEVSAEHDAIKEKTPEPVAAKDKSPEPPAQETVSHPGKDESLESPAEIEAKSEVSAEPVAVKEKTPEPVAAKDKSPEPPTMVTVPQAGKDKSPEPPAETDAKLKASAEPDAIKEKSPEPVPVHDKSPEPPAQETMPHAGKDKSLESPAEADSKLEVSVEPAAVKEESPAPVTAKGMSPEPPARVPVLHARKDKSLEPPAEPEAKLEVSAEHDAIKDKTSEPVAVKDKSPEPPAKEIVPYAGKDKDPKPLAEPEGELEVTAEPHAVKEESPELVAEGDRSPVTPAKESALHADRDKSPEPPSETEAKSEVSAEPDAVKEKSPEPAAEQDKPQEPPAQETVPQAGKDKSLEPPAEAEAKSEVPVEPVVVKDRSPEPVAKETVPHAGKYKSPEPPSEAGTKSEVCGESVAIKEKSLKPAAAKDKVPKPAPREIAPHAKRDKSPELPAATDAKSEVSAEHVAVKERTPELVAAKDMSAEPAAKETTPHTGKDKNLAPPAETAAKSEMSAEPVVVKQKIPESLAAKDKSPEPPAKEATPHAQSDKSPQPLAEADAKSEVSAEPDAVEKTSPAPVVEKDKPPEPPVKVTAPHTGKDKSPEPPSETETKSEVCGEPAAVKETETVAAPEPPAQQTVPHVGKDKGREPPTETRAKSDVSPEPVAVRERTPAPAAAKDKSPEVFAKETAPHAERDKSPEPPAETDPNSEGAAETHAVEETSPEPVAAKDMSPEPPAKETVPHARKDKSPESPSETDKKSEVSVEPVAIVDRPPDPVPAHDKSPELPAQETVPHAGKDKSLDPPAEREAKSEVAAEPVAVKERTPEPVAAKDKSPEPPAKEAAPHAERDKSAEPPAETDAKLEVSAEPLVVKESSPAPVVGKDTSPELPAKETEPHAQRDKSPEPPAETEAELAISAEPVAAREKSPETVAVKHKSPEPPAKETVPHAGKQKGPELPVETDAKPEVPAEPVVVKGGTPAPVFEKDRSPVLPAKKAMQHVGKGESTGLLAETEAKSDESAEPVAVKEMSPEPVAEKYKSPGPPAKVTVPHAERDKSPEPPAETDAKSEMSAEPVAVKEGSPKPVVTKGESLEAPSKETVPHTERGKSPEPPAEIDAKSEVSAEPHAVKEKSPEPVAAKGESLEAPSKETVPHAERGRSPEPPAETDAKSEVSAEPVAVKEGSPKPVVAKGELLEAPSKETTSHAERGESPEPLAKTMGKSEVSAELILAKEELLQPDAKEDTFPESPFVGQDKSVDEQREDDKTSKPMSRIQKTPEEAKSLEKLPELVKITPTSSESVADKLKHLPTTNDVKSLALRSVTFAEAVLDPDANRMSIESEKSPDLVPASESSSTEELDGVSISRRFKMERTTSGDACTCLPHDSDLSDEEDSLKSTIPEKCSPEDVSSESSKKEEPGVDRALKAGITMVSSKEVKSAVDDEEDLMESVSVKKSETEEAPYLSLPDKRTEAGTETLTSLEKALIFDDPQISHASIHQQSELGSMSYIEKTTEARPRKGAEEWETTKQEIKSPAVDGIAAQKGKTTTTTQQVPIVDKPLSPTLNGLSTRISKPNAIFDQTTALIESESRGEPYNPRTEAHYLVEETKLTSPDASKDDKKKKKGILGTIKNIVGKSFDSDSDSEKSPKKEKRDKKQRTKPTGKDAPPEAPVRPPRKPKSPTPTLERKYENIPYVEATPSAANDERETYVTSITIPVADLDESRTYVNTEVLDTTVPVASRKKETVIVQETFTKTIQPLRIEEKEFTIIIDPSQKDKQEVGYEEVASPPVRPPRHKAHVYEDISQPLTDVKKSTTDLIESEASDRADREDKSGFEDKHSDSQKGKRKYGKLFGLFGKSKDVEESDDDSSRAEVIEKHDKETSKEDTSVVLKSEEQKSPKMKSKSKEKDDKTFLSIFKKKQERPAFSDAVIKDMIDSTAFLKEEVEKYHDVKRHSPEPKAQLVVSESFTDALSTNSETIIPISKDHDATTTIEEIEIQPVIQEVTTVKVTEKIEHPAESEISPRHTKREGKGGFLGLFKKKGSEEPDSKDATRREEFLKTQTETDSFLKGEISNYHDVRPVVEKPTADKEKSIVMKEVTIMREDKVSISKDHDVTATTKEIEIQPVIQEVTTIEVTEKIEHPTESEISPRHTKRDGKGGFLGLFKKKGSEEPDSKDLIRREEFWNTQTETDSFLKGETSNYHDVRPVVEKSTADKEKSIVMKEVTIMREDKVPISKDHDVTTTTKEIEIQPVIQEVTTVEVTEKIKHPTESEISPRHTKREGKGGFLGLFKKKGSEEPDSKDVIQREEFLKTQTETDSFLKGEVSNYHDVRPVVEKPTAESIAMKEVTIMREDKVPISKDNGVTTTTKEIEIQPVIQEVTTVEVTEKIEHPAESEISPRHTKRDGKGGFLGLFKKKGSEEPDSKDLIRREEFLKTQTETDSFLKGETSNYHDVRPVVEKSTADKEKSIVMKEVTIMRGDKVPISKDHDVTTTTKEIEIQPVIQEVTTVEVTEKIEHPAESESSPRHTKRDGKGGFLGLFKKKGSEEPDSRDVIRQEEFVKTQTETDSFLKGETSNYHDVRPVVEKSTADKEKSIVVKEVTIMREDKVPISKDHDVTTTTKEIEIQPVIQEVTTVEVTEKIEHPAGSEISPRHTKRDGKGGFLGLFKKKGSEEPDSKDLIRREEFLKTQSETDSFLKGETSNYHDVRPVVEISIADEGKAVLVKEVIIMKDDKVAAERTKDEKPGLLGLFRKEGPKIETDTRSDELVRTQIETNSFLESEVSNYHDVRPLIDQTESNIAEIGQSATTKDKTISKEEKPIQQATKKDIKGGFLGIFKKKAPEIEDTQEILTTSEPGRSKEDADSFLKTEVSSYHDVKPERKEKVVPSEEPVIIKEIIVVRQEDTASGITSKSGSKSEKQDKQLEQCDTLKTKEDTDKFVKNEIEIYHDVKPVIPKEIMTEKPHSKELKEEKMSPKKTKKEGKKGLLGLFAKKDSDRASPEKLDDKEITKVTDDTDSFLQKEVELYHDERQTASELHKETVNNLKDENKLPLVYKETIIIKEECRQDQMRAEDTEAAIKAKTATDSFLRDEVNGYNDVRPMATERSLPLEEDVPKGASLVEETVKQAKEQTSPKKARKETDKAGGFLGIFKKSKDDQKSEEPQQDDSNFVKLKLDTFEFLKSEVDKHHDVRPIIKDAITESRDHTIQEETGIQEERLSPKKVGKEEEKSGILKLFKKKGSEEKELKRRSLEREKKHDVGYIVDKKIMEDTSSFLKGEVSRYHDVRPVVKEKLTSSEQASAEPELSMEEVTKVEQSPEKGKRDEQRTGILRLFKKKGSEEKELKRRSAEKELQQKLEHEDNIKIRENTNSFLVHEIEKHDDVKPVISQTAVNIEAHKKTPELAKEKDSPKKSIKHEEKGGILRIFKKKGSEETELKREDKAEHEENLKVRQDTKEFLDKEVDKFHDVRPAPTHVVTTETSTTKMEAHIETGSKDEEKSGILGFFKKKGSEEKELKRRSLEDKSAEETVMKEEKISPKKSRNAEKAIFSGIFKKKESSMDSDLKDDSEEAIKVIQDTSSFLTQEVDKYEDVRPIVKEAAVGSEIYKITEEPIIMKETIVIKEETSSGAKTKTKISKLESEVSEGLTKVKQETDKVVKSEEQILWEEKVSKEEKGGFLSIFKRKEHDVKLEDESGEAEIKIRKETDTFLQDEINRYHDVKPLIMTPRTVEHVQDSVDAEKSEERIERKEKDGGGFLGLFKKKDPEELKEQNRLEKERQIKTRNDTDMFLSEEIDKYHDVRPIVDEKAIAEVNEKGEAEPVVVNKTIVEQAVIKQPKEDVASPKPSKKVGKGILGLLGWKSHDEGDEKDITLHSEQFAKIKRETDMFINDEITWYHDVRPVITQKTIEKPMQSPVVYKETMVLKQEGTSVSPKPRKKEGKGILRLFEKKGSEDRESVCKKDSLEEPIKVKEDTDSFIKQEIDKYHDVRPKITQEVPKESEGISIVTKETVVLREAKQDSPSPKSKKRHSKGLLGLFEKKGSEDKDTKNNEELEQLVKIRKETDTFLKDEVDKYHDVPPKVKEQNDETSIAIATLNKEATVEGKASPQQKKKEGKGVFGIFAKKDVKATHSIDPADSEQPLKIKDDTDTFLKDEINRYHDVKPAAEGNFTEEHVDRDTSAIAEKVTLSPKSKKRDGKGILGWFSKKGSEERDIVNTTEAQQLLKLRQDTEEFLKDEIDKFHDVRPTITENLVIKMTEEPKEKPTIIKETIVIKEDDVSLLPRDQKTSAVGSDDIMKVKKDTDKFLKDEIDRFYDVRSEEKTDDFQREETDKNRDVKPLVEDKVQTASEQSVILSKASVTEESQVAVKKEDTGGLLGIFKRKHADHGELKEQEKHDQTKAETGSFLEKEIDVYHDAKPVIKQDITDHNIVTEGSISRILEEPVIMRETIVIRDETQTAKKDKEKDGKGKFLHIFKKKSHSGDHVDQLEHEQEVKIRIETDEFLKTEVDKFHDARPIVKEEARETLETKPESFEATTKKEEGKGGILAFFTKKTSEEPLKEEIGRHHDVKPILAQDMSQADHAERSSSEKQKLAESGLAGMPKKKTSDDTVDKKINEELVKTKSQTDSFLKGEVDKYHDAKSPIKIIEEKITVELEQPMVLEKTIIITEQETPGTQQLAPQQEASAEGHLPEIKVQTDKFLREEVERYDDVKEAKTVHVATVPKKDDEDSDKGGFFGFFKKKGSEDRELNEKSSVTPIKETVSMQQEETSPRKGKRDEAKGIFGIFKKKGSEEREAKVQEKNLEKDQFEEAKVESDKFIQGEVEMYHDVRPTLKEKMVNEEDSVIKDMPMVKDTDTITKPKVEKSDGVTEMHSKEATKDESETVKECKKESPKPTSKEHGKGGLFGIFKKKDHKASISKDELEDNAKIRNETDVFLQDEINKYHDVHQVTGEGTADDLKCERQTEKGVLSGLIKKGGGTDKEMEDKKRVVFKEDLEETQADQPKRMIEHLESQEATTGEKLDDKRKEREVGDEDFMILTPGQVDSLKEIEIHRITEETIRVKEGTAIIKTESIAISSPEKEAVKEDVQENMSKTEGVQPHLPDRVVRQMIDTSDFIREEVARYEDVRPITRSTDVEAKIEEPSTKGPKLFGLFSKKKSQDESVEKDKTKSKKKKEEQEATHAASESKDFSQKEVDRFHGKEGKESGSGFFGLFSKKTKPQEKSAKYDSDGSQVISTQTLQTMKDSSDFLQNEVALYHDVRYVPDKVLTDIEIFEPIVMSPIDVSEKTLQNINECNKFIHEEVDGIPESVLKGIRDSKEDEHTLESPTRTVTYTTKVESIPHGERTTRVSEEVITGTIHLGPDVLSDLTKLEDEINKKLEQIRKETSTEENGADTTAKHSDSMQTTKSEKVDRISQERPSPHKEPEEQMFTKSGSPFKLFGRKMSEEEVKRLQEEEHSIPGTYRVKDEDQVEYNSIKISKESLKKMQDTQDFLSTELDNYESGKPEVITDLDDEIEKSKSSGIFSIFGKKESSPKPTKKKVKKQKSGKRDESQAEDSKRTGKPVSGILGKIGEKITGKTEAHKIEEITIGTSRESSLEKEASRKDTPEVIKSLENIQSTVQSAYDETSSFAGELIKKFEDKLDESHSEIKKQSESLKKSIDEDNEQKIRSESKSPAKEVGEIEKEIDGTAKYLEKKATDKGEHVGKAIQKDAIVVEAAVASSVQNVEDVAEAARDNLQSTLQTSHIDTQKTENEVEKELIKIEPEKAKQKALSLEAQDEIEDRRKESKGFLGKLAKKIDSAMSSTSKAMESGVEATRLQMEKEQEELYKAQNDVKELIECTEKSAKDRVEVIEKRLDGVAQSTRKTVSEAKTDVGGGFKKMEDKVEDRIDHQAEKANKVAVELKDGSEKSVQEAGRKQKELESDVVKAVDETKKKSRGFLGKLGKKIESAVSSTTKHADDSLTSTEAKVSDGVSEVTKDVTKSASQIEKDVQDKFEEARTVVKDTANTEAEKMQQIEADTMRAAKEAGEKLKESEAATGEDVDKAKKKGKSLLDRLSKKIESAVSGTEKVVDEIALSADTEIQDIKKASNNALEKSSKDIGTLKETSQDRITSEKDSVARSLKSAEEGVEGIAKDITDFATETKKEIEDRSRESGKAIRGQVTAAEREIQKSMTEVGEAVEQIKKETQSNINEAVSETKSVVINESEATKRKGKGFLGKLSKKLSGKKDTSMEKADEAEPSSDIRLSKAESVEKTGITGKADQIPDIKADEESENKLMSHSNVQHIFSEPAMSDIKQRTIDFIESESLKVDDPKMTRTLSDYGCQLKEQPRIPGARKISEVNMDLSNLPSDAADFSPLSDKAHSYVTSPSSSRRTHSVHVSKTERPEIVELSDSAMQESTKDEFYIITEPREVITTVTTEIKSKKPLFHIESEEDDSLSKSEDDQRDKPRSNVLDTLAEQSLETLISDMTRGMEESIEKVQHVIKKEEKKLMKHKVEAEADVDAIEKKLRDLDTALDSLEQIQTKTETITIVDTKTEKKLKRVERKFERMASEVLEKEKTDAKQKQMTSPEVEERQETEYRELVSQLSTDEITDFQKEYSHLWDEHTFSKSSDWESKTPDSQADVQELPKDCLYGSREIK
ncbi:unnamed protein product [Callosobruchus maculatus]|uniref:Uncharacterized protein n=2 Tax=Callosobruchus maculatus TaxID=64391 RepID=A0A653DIA7_CALMS|nr:unnamed protein product [Callosobruchus maculatus]